MILDNGVMEKAVANLNYEMNDSKAWYQLIGRIGKTVKCLPDVTPKGNAHIEEKIIKLVADKEALELQVKKQEEVNQVLLGMIENLKTGIQKSLDSLDIMEGKI